ncbi:MAG: PP0621 family protein [Halothiobacillaceae bacterium]
MYKLLFWVVVIIALVLYVRHRIRARNRDPVAERRAPPTAMKAVSCRHCGLHVPESEAVRHDGKTFCSWEHANAWKQDRPGRH